MTDVFAHLWSTAETRELFEDAGRTRMWLGVIAALAAEQGELGLIPAPAALEIAERARRCRSTSSAVAEETRRSGHSTLGLIRVLQRDLGEAAKEWVYYGATVQDVSRHMDGPGAQRMLAIAERDLGTIEASLVALASRHRDTVMLGRTHGQPGLPITFGFKAAVWVAEMRRHRERDRAGAAAAGGRAAGRRGRHAVRMGRGRAGAAAARDGATRARRPGR